MSNMTPQQAAEVLRKMKIGINGGEQQVVMLHDLTAALETAIAVMETTPPTDDEISNAAIEYSGFCEAREHDPECSCATFEEGAKWAIARLAAFTPPTDE